MAVADQWRNTGAALTRMLARATPDSIQAEDVAIVRAELDQLRQRLAEAEAQLAECFRLGGADNDGNGESWQAQRAVESVRNLRKDYDDACEEMYGEGGLNKRAEQAEAKLALAEQDARRWRDRCVDYRTAYWRPTQPYEQARFLAESEAIDLENKFQEARDRRAAIDGSGESLPPHKEGGD